MEPIVSPWFIYVLSLLNALIGVTSCITVLSGVLIFFLVAGYFAFYDDDEFLTMYRKVIKKAIVVFAVASVVAFFTPTKNTAIQMYVAKTITYSKISNVKNAGESLKDEIKKDIIDIIRAIKTPTKKQEK